MSNVFQSTIPPFIPGVNGGINPNIWPINMIKPIGNIKVKKKKNKIVPTVNKVVNNVQNNVQNAAKKAAKKAKKAQAAQVNKIVNNVQNNAQNTSKKKKKKAKVAQTPQANKIVNNVQNNCQNASKKKKKKSKNAKVNNVANINNMNRGNNGHACMPIHKASTKKPTMNLHDEKGQYKFFVSVRETEGHVLKGFIFKERKYSFCVESATQGGKCTKMELYLQLKNGKVPVKMSKSGGVTHLDILEKDIPNNHITIVGRCYLKIKANTCYELKVKGTLVI